MIRTRSVDGLSWDCCVFCGLFAFFFVVLESAWWSSYVRQSSQVTVTDQYCLSDEKRFNYDYSSGLAEDGCSNANWSTAVHTCVRMKTTMYIGTLISSRRGVFSMLSTAGHAGRACVLTAQVWVPAARQVFAFSAVYNSHYEL